MIEMTISGRSSLGKKATRDFLEWMSCKLKIDRYKKPIFLDVVYKKDLFKKERHKGSILCEDIGCRPREFSIEVDSSLSPTKIIEVLSHEMIHCWQYATGRWRETPDPRIHMWKGKKLNASKLSYRSYPWESEAYALEKVYAREYLKGKL